MNDNKRKEEVLPAVLWLHFTFRVTSTFNHQHSVTFCNCWLFLRARKGFSSSKYSLAFSVSKSLINNVHPVLKKIENDVQVGNSYYYLQILLLNIALIMLRMLILVCSVVFYIYTLKQMVLYSTKSGSLARNHREPLLMLYSTKSWCFSGSSPVLWHDWRAI